MTRRWCDGDADRLKRSAQLAYLSAVIVLPVVITLASFLRDRELLLSNISLWLFVVSFLVTLVRTSVGLSATLLLLTVSPALHLQLNSVSAFPLHALNYPGVDCCMGFLAAWVSKGRLASAAPITRSFPGTWLLVLHAWIAASALVAVARNIWQSASELTLRGFLYNIYLLRQLSWHDDYFPLHDLFVYSAAIGMIIAVWALLRQYGQQLFKHVLVALLVGFAVNAAFALSQKVTGAGWTGGGIESSVNAFWPDLHSFAALMVLSLLFCYGYLRTQPTAAGAKLLVVSVMLLSAVALYLSGSRSTIFIAFIGLAACSVTMLLRAKGRERALAVLVIALLAIGTDWMLRYGYRGFSYQSLKTVTEGLTFATIDNLLSQRPGIWQAALLMYGEFPWFGLGQGTFYRLSSVPGFSDNAYLVGAGGENAHNYPLQTFVELGPIGVLLIVMCCLPIIQQGRNNFKFVSFYALLAILLGNSFAHALLVREMLMLCAVFLAMYYWQNEGEQVQAQPSFEYRKVKWVVTGLIVLAAVEVAYSFKKFPFAYGQRCFQASKFAPDGWSSGFLKQPIPDSAAQMQLSLLVDRPDVTRRPLSIDLGVIDANSTPLWSRAVQVHEPSAFRFTVELPGRPQASTYLTIRASHCYVPLNLGITYDRRALGVRIDELRFVSKGG